MITRIDQVISDLVSKGISPVPLFPNSKQPEDKAWQKIKYDNSRFMPDSNVGANLAMSGICHVDADNEVAEHFCRKWLPHNTLIVGRKHKIDNKEYKVVTNYFYKNNGIISENQSYKDSNKVQVLEFRCNGQSVVYGKTPLKDDETILAERYFVNDTEIAECSSLQHLVYKIWLACKMVDWNIGMNQGALKLDSCIMRYCKWADDERIDFILSIGEYVDPNGRDTNLAKMRRIVESNNKETKNSGYVSLADQLGVDKLEVKNLFRLIGSVPDSDNYEKVKSVVSFNDKSLDMKQLMNTDIPPLKYAIKPIMPEGMGAIAGRPKAMKSWTALDACYAVQNGLQFMGHETEQGDVLYLALEDSKRRIKDRVLKLKNEKLNAPDIMLASDVPYLGFGFEESLLEWIESKEKPRLIVIDTLARIKPRQKKSAGTAYDLDNELLNKLQTIAIQKNISVCFVTHLSKATQDYSWDRIQGSVGMQGMTDFMWLIDRGDNAKHASLTGRGRDINDFEYAVRWDSDQWRYKFDGNLQMVEMNENRREVIDAMNVLKNEGIEDVHPRDLCKHYNVSVTSKDGRRISKTMQRMANDFEIWKGKKYGTYTLKNPISL